MNKLVITEISRIQGLIGKPLIMEGWGDIAKEGLELITKKLGKQSVAIEDLLLKLSKATSEVQIRNILSKLVDSSKEIADILIPKILSTLNLN
jgi:homospermidine synthase